MGDQGQKLLCLELALDLLGQEAVEELPTMTGPSS